MTQGYRLEPEENTVFVLGDGFTFETVDGKTMRIVRPLKMDFYDSPHLNWKQICGRYAYASIVLSGETVTELVDELKHDIFPFLWREYVTPGLDSLSSDARMLRFDLLERFEEATEEQLRREFEERDDADDISHVVAEGDEEGDWPGKDRF